MLTEKEFARIRGEHVPVRSDLNPDKRVCAKCCLDKAWSSMPGPEPFPCDAARLLAHFTPGPVPHLAGVAYGLMGPSVSDELAR